MNTLKLYSTLKVNQKKAKETKYNHTRIIMAISATIIAIFCLASCATDKSKYHFDSSKDALASYHVYLSELQKKESLSSDDFVATISNWSELRDSVYTYISKDSAFYAHTYLSSEFYSLHDDLPLDKTGHSKTFLESRSPPHNIIMRRTSKPLLTQPKRFMPLLTALKFSKQTKDRRLSYTENSFPA